MHVFFDHSGVSVIEYKAIHQQAEFIPLYALSHAMGYELFRDLDPETVGVSLIPHRAG